MPGSSWPRAGSGRAQTPLLTSAPETLLPGSLTDTTHGPPRQPRGRRLPGRGAGTGWRPTSPASSPTPGAWAGPGSSTRAGSSALAWERKLGARRLDLRGLARRVRRPGRAHVAAGHLERGVRPGRRPGPGRRHGGGAARPHPHRLRHRRAEAPLPRPRSAGAPSCGARATPSPTPAPTWPTCRPRRSATATSGSSPARRSGPPTPSGPTGASCVCRTDPEAPRHKGLSYLLVPMDQPGIEVRPIRQITGTSEFNEVFFDGARTDADLVVGEVNDGWRVALATLAFERGVGLLGDIVGFRKELDQLLELAAQERAHRRPRAPPAPGRRLDPALHPAAQHAALAHRRGRPGGPARGVDLQAVLGHLAPRPRRAGHGRPRHADAAGGRRRRPTSSATSSGSSSSAGPTPSTAGPTRSSATSSASASSGSRPSPRSPPPPKGAPAP